MNVSDKKRARESIGRNNHAVDNLFIILLVIDAIDYVHFMCVLKIVFKNIENQLGYYFTNQQVAALQFRCCASCRLPRGKLDFLFQPR